MPRAWFASLMLANSRAHCDSQRNDRPSHPLHLVRSSMTCRPSAAAMAPRRDRARPARQALRRNAGGRNGPKPGTVSFEHALSWARACGCAGSTGIVKKSLGIPTYLERDGVSSNRRLALAGSPLKLAVTSSPRLVVEQGRAKNRPRACLHSSDRSGCGECMYVAMRIRRRDRACRLH